MVDYKYLIIALVLVGSVTIPAYAEYCIESNGGTWHCFTDDYDSNNNSYDYVGADMRNDYWNNQYSDLNCYGDDYRCMPVSYSSDYSTYIPKSYDDYNFGNHNYLENGCTGLLPYLHSDGYCYDYQEYNYDDYLDNGCYVDRPYRWSNGDCNSSSDPDPESFYYYLDNGCMRHSPNLWSDGSCHLLPESLFYDNNYDDYLDNGCYVDVPYLYSDGECYTSQKSAEMFGKLENGCTGLLPYLYSDGSCHIFKETFYDDSNYDDSNYDDYDYSSYEPSNLDKIFHVTDSKGNSYSWTLNRDAWDKMIINGNDLSESNKQRPLSIAYDSGKVTYTTNLDGFVYGAFGEIIDDISNNSRSNENFIYEVWYIVSKLTEYNSDQENYIGDEGRYALDTLARGGGDCEDLAILIADMLMSSKHTKNWTIEYIYMDIDNPTNPQEVNHVMLKVNDGNEDYFIEATGDPSWNYYPNGISGWHFDVIKN